MIKFSILTFLRNLRYLGRYNLKEINNNLHSYTYMSNFADLLRYEIKNDFDKITPPLIKTPIETLQTLIDTQKSLIRFGDGEYSLMEGRNIPFQKYDENLAKTLQEAITSQDENLLVGVNGYYFHIPEGVEIVPWRYSYIVNNLHIVKKYLLPGKEYGSARMGGVCDYEMFKKLFADKKLLVVCGDKVLNVEYSIFEYAKDSIKEIAFIYGPTTHAYREIDTLREKILAFEKDWVLVFAIGPAGKALGYEMFQKGYRVLDIGHTIKGYDYYKRGVKMDKETIRKFFAPDE